MTEETLETTENEARSRSSIDFPYNDQEDAEEVVLAIHRNAGTACSVEQLAGFMGFSLRGGGFRTKLSSSKSFGYIDNPRGQVVLTELGLRLVDPKQQQAARVEGFLSVALFRALYNKFKGNVLPPKPALTREIITLGVIESQADRARQVFDRSADFAGFYAHGRDRLVMPVVQTTPSAEKTPDDPKPAAVKAFGGASLYDPLIQGLLNRLPEPSTDWPVEARATWLRALVTNFDLLYGDSSGRQITVNVS